MTQAAMDAGMTANDGQASDQRIQGMISTGFDGTKGHLDEIRNEVEV